MRLRIKVENKLEKQFFTSTEIDLLWTKIYSMIGSGVSEPELGRLRVDLDRDIPEQIIAKVESYAKQKDPSLFFTAAYYTEYSNKYGNPNLTPHTDSTECVFTIDYQLYSNIDWPVFVEGEAYHLNDNEFLTINVQSQVHWRPERKFSDGEVTRMIFFHFNKAGVYDLKVPTIEELGEMNKKWEYLYRSGDGRI